MNIVQWFADNIFGDLQAGASGVYPVLQVDAIRYLYSFRNQACSRISMCSWPCANTYSLTAHKRTAGFGVAIAPEPARFPRCSGIHLRRRGTRPHIVYARGRLYHTHVRFPCVQAGFFVLPFLSYLCRFSSADVQPFALQLLNALLSKIEVQQSPERVAENDFLMRCALVYFIP